MCVFGHLHPAFHPEEHCHQKVPCGSSEGFQTIPSVNHPILKKNNNKSTFLKHRKARLTVSARDFLLAWLVLPLK